MIMQDYIIGNVAVMPLLCNRNPGNTIVQISEVISDVVICEAAINATLDCEPEPR